MNIVTEGADLDASHPSSLMLEVHLRSTKPSRDVGDVASVFKFGHLSTELTVWSERADMAEH